jgi:hypothetical protein
MACRSGESTTVRCLSVSLHINGSGPGYPATTASPRRMCTGGWTSCSAASRCRGDRPTLVNSLWHLGRAPRPWHAFAAVASGVLRETTRLLPVGIRSSVSIAEVAGTYRGTAQHAAASTIDKVPGPTLADLLIDALSTSGLASMSSRRSTRRLCRLLAWGCRTRLEPSWWDPPHARWHLSLLVMACRRPVAPRRQLLQSLQDTISRPWSCHWLTDLGTPCPVSAACCL